jgi:hypothetical protein
LNQAIFNRQEARETTAGFLKSGSELGAYFPFSFHGDPDGVDHGVFGVGVCYFNYSSSWGAICVDELKDTGLHACSQLFAYFDAMVEGGSFFEEVFSRD